ncbi:MAG: exodeoxyribonuclease VII small subunit [Verrucomicrobiales bacterium]|nr:exodeoxyribonuclease VII small subunit [Verrucomicrobiales bacterium]
MPKTTEKKATADPELPFEEAMARLESLIQGMDSDQVPLDDLIKNYEEGISLYEICEKRLDEAQGRIDLIRKKKDGTVVLEQFGDDDTAPISEVPQKQKENTSVSSENDDFFGEDGELF